jgi:hypothetical protein
MRLLLCALVLLVAAPAADATPLLGIDYSKGARGRLTQLDPLTLRPVSRAIAIRGYAWGQDLSDDGARAAIGSSSDGRVTIVDVASMRVQRRMRLGQTVRALSWVDRDHLVALTGFETVRAWVVNVADGKVAHAAIDGRDVAIAEIDGGLAVLLAPLQGIGDARLAIVRAGQPLRTIPVPLRAGSIARTGRPKASDPPDLLPGLAVDRAAGVAYVVDAAAPRVVTVDLATSAVAAHDVVRASASKGGATSMRTAVWLGGGRLAVSGQEAGAPDDRYRPHGLRIIETAGWTERIASRLAGFVLPALDGLVVPEFRRPGLHVFGRDGRRRFTISPRDGVSNVQVAGRYAYVRNARRRGRDHRTHVVDLRSGRVVRHLKTTRLPFFIVPTL